jgi:hypothetical protein
MGKGIGNHRYISKSGLSKGLLKNKLIDYYKRYNITYKNKPLPSVKIEKDVEKCLWVISAILYRQLVYKKDDENRTLYGEYIPLYSKILQSALGNQYNTIINFLLEDKIIETKYNNNGNPTYEVGNTSRLFRLNLEYARAQTFFDEYVHLKDRIKKAIEKEYLKLNDIHKHLYSFLDDLYISDMYNWQKKHEPLVVMFESQNKASRYKVDKSGRSYHKLTNMFSFARHYIRYKGEHLVSIDCANSQPLLLYYLYDSERREQPQDLLNYKELVLKGQFYEHLQVVYNKMYPLKQKDRKEIKVETYKRILFNPKQNKNHPLLKAFAMEFPTVYQIILENQKHKDDLSGKLRYVESKLWIDGIATKIMKHNPKIPIFILHDSVFTIKKHHEEVLQIVKNTFNEQLGKEPLLHVTFYGWKTKQFDKDKKKYEIDIKKVLQSKRNTARLKKAKQKKLNKQTKQKVFKYIETVQVSESNLFFNGLNTSQTHNSINSPPI